jgi:hypothetical protein
MPELSALMFKQVVRVITREYHLWFLEYWTSL